MILIVGSHHDDVIYFQSALKDPKEEIILNKYRATIGSILNQEVMVLQDIFTSYVSSAVLTHIIEKYYVLMVFCVGTCLSKHKDVKLGDIVLSEYCGFGDVDQIKMIKGTELGQIPGYPQLFEANDELLRNVESSLNSIGYSSFIPCTFFNSSYYRKDEEIIKELSLNEKVNNANEKIVVDGVSTGIALACHLFDVPFLSVKVVEGYAGEKVSVDNYIEVLEKFAVIGKAIIFCIGDISRTDVLRG